MKKLLNNRGGALVMVIITMAVLMILGISLLVVSGAETRHATQQQRQTEAHYNAQKGAVAVANYLVANRGEDPIKDLYDNQSAENFFDGTINSGDAVVDVIGLDEDTLEVVSTWDSGRHNDTVRVRLQKGIAPTIAGEYGIQSKTSANASGNAHTVYSNVAAWDGGTINVEEGFHFFDSDDLGDYDAYMATFPDIKDWPSDFSGYTITSTNVSNPIDYIDTIGTSHPYHVLINNPLHHSGAGSGMKFITNDEMFIKVNGGLSLTGNAKLILDGTGPIHILVDGDLELGANSVNELGEEIGPENFIFYVTPGNSVKLSGTTTISSMIVAPYSNMTTQGTPTFDGISWVNSFSGGGNFTYSQNPIDDEFFEGGFFDWPLQITAYLD